MRGGLAAALLALAPGAAAGAASPEVDYMLHCQGCHLPDGSGAPGAVPTLGGSMARFLAVPGGRAYLVRVPGSALSELDDARLAALLNWMLRRFGPEELAARFPPFEAAEVGRLRARPLVETESLRRALLAAMPPAPARTRP